MTASTDTKPATTKSSSRRALLAGALGGIGAVAAGAMAKVSPVRAAKAIGPGAAPHRHLDSPP